MDPLDEVVKQLGSSVEVVRDEQQVMKQRDVVTTNCAHPPSIRAREVDGTTKILTASNM
jgi:hypothetical protein